MLCECMCVCVGGGCLSERALFKKNYYNSWVVYFVTIQKSVNCELTEEIQN